MLNTEIRLAEGWIPIKINKDNSLYVNIPQNIATMTPVFSLDQARQILKAADQNIDFKNIDQQIEKLKSVIGDGGNSQLTTVQIDDEKNLEIQLETKKFIEKEGIKIFNEHLGRNAIKTSLDNFIEECSLLQSIIMQQFHSQPTYQEERLQSGEFHAKLIIQEKTFSRGFGQNKKTARRNAALNLLTVLCPNIYKQWKFNEQSQSIQINPSRNKEQSSHEDYQPTENYATLKEKSLSTDNYLPQIDESTIIFQNLKIEISPGEIQNDKDQFEQDTFLMDTLLNIQQQENIPTFEQIEQSNFKKEHSDFYEGTKKTEEQDFTLEQLEAIKKNEDAHIDDPLLLDSKKNILKADSPLSVYNVIKSKYQNLDIIPKDWTESVSAAQERQIFIQSKNNQNVFFYKFTSASRHINVEAWDFVKKKAEQRACQQLLKALFPKGTTWNQMLTIVFDNKQKLEEIFNDKQR